MTKGGKFSVYEGVLFITTIISSKILYTSPSIVLKAVGTAAWYNTLVSCITALSLFLIICALLERFPGISLTKIFEVVLGKLLGKLISLSTSGYILYYTASTLREFLEMIKVHTLPDTPPSAILIVFIAVCMLISYKGIESIVRLACINFYPILLGLTTILILAYPYYDLDYIKPYFGYGVKQTLYTGILRSSAYLEVMTLPTIFISMHSVRDCRKIGSISILLSGLIFSISFLCYIMTFQYTMSIENLSGIFQLSRIIYFSRYFQRVESIFIFSWVISALLSVASGFYLSIRIYCQGFNITDHKPVIIPFALLIYTVALQPRNVSELIGVNLSFIRQYSCIPAYGIPILVLIFSIVFKKKGVSTSK